MLKKLVVCIAFMPALVVAGESGGIVESNYELNAGYSESRHSDHATVSGTLNLPISEYSGSNLFVGGSKADGHDNVLDSDAYSVGGTAFLRDFEIGKIGVLGSYSKHDFDFPSNVTGIDDEQELYQYSLLGELYLGNLTFGTDRTILNAEDGEDYHSWSGFVSLYLREDTKLMIAGNGMDASDSYTLQVSHQPGFLNDSVGISFAYDGARHDDTFRLSIDYYFDTQVSLIERDRRYR